MQCKYVRESTCMSFTFHPKTISLFSLVHFKNRLRIIQQNLYTGLIMNDFPVPLKQQTKQVDNYQLSYNPTLDLIILTLSNHILLYSIAKKSLVSILQSCIKSSPLFIDRICTRSQNLYFSSPAHKLVYGINIVECVKNANINNYLRYKISGTQAQICEISCTDKVLVAICSDRVLRVWDVDTYNQLKGIALENIGRPTCFCFSKNDAYLLIGTSDGYTQAFDGENLGVRNVRVMSQKICNIKIQSVCWFHYAGQSHSLRFLAFTQDGNIKLYSFWFEKKQQSVQGRCSQLSLLYTNRHNILQNFMINSHSFANFIFFSPGVLLYMVDFHPLVYYPVVPKIPSQSFASLTPTPKKQVFYPRDILFMKNLQILRLKDTIQPKLTLQDDLEYKELKILKLEMRPSTSSFAPEYSKLMVVYYLNSCIRVITVSRVDLNRDNGELGGYKEYNGSWVGFLGPREYHQPFIFIVQEDKQTMTVLSQNPQHPKDPEYSSPQQQKYFQLGPGQLYTKKLSIKIHKVYPTPFRNSYVLLYQSDNLLRFSNNINYETQLINYDVFTGISLRMDYTDIVFDVIWTYAGEIGVVVCLDKVVFINSDLKVMRSVVIAGYIVQAVWIGYTLIITTKKDVQYVDILSKPQQAYCLQSLQSKYLIAQIMSDRIIGIQKSCTGQITPKCRYFKLTQPLISGYLNYQKLAQIPISEQKIKQIIQAFIPYYIVTQQFISLLNQRGLSSISKYFIEGNQKMYSKSLRAKTLNQRVKIERFIQQQIWNKNKKNLMDLFLAYEESKDSNDPYQLQKGKTYANKIKSIIGGIAFDSIKDLTSVEDNKGVVINNNFGQQSLYQLYYDISKQNHQIKMQIYPFKAQNCGQWLGHYNLYLQSKPYFNEQPEPPLPSSLSNQAVTTINHMIDIFGGDYEEEVEGQEDQNMFKNLGVYYRCDDGKGELVEDLSDFGNNGWIGDGGDGGVWGGLDQEPMEVVDKWGKKCPPQFCLSAQIKINKKLNIRKTPKLSIQIWVQPLTNSFDIICMPEDVFLSCKNLNLELKIGQSQIKLQPPKSVDSDSIPHLEIGNWSHLSLTINSKQKPNRIYLYCNSILIGEANPTSLCNGKFAKNINGLTVGDNNGGLQFTQVRVWTKEISQEDIKENMRTPLELVAEKRKRLKMKLKEKKKKEETSTGLNAFSLD